MHLCLEDRIRFDRIIKYKDKINFEYLVQNENMPLRLLQYLRENGFEDQLPGSVMSRSRIMTLKFIKDHSFLDWDYDLLSYNMMVLRVVLF